MFKFDKKYSTINRTLKITIGEKNSQLEFNNQFEQISFNRK